MQEKKECPICSGIKFTNHQSCIDHTVSHETFNIVRCETCQLAITTPRPNDADLGKYYASDKYISHTSNAKSFIDSIYLLARKLTLKKKLKLITKYHTKPGRILDYGCGTGEFINICKSDNWTTYGVEPSDSARQKASQTTKQKILSTLKNIDQKHDVITLWHVLEHIPDLEQTIDSLYELLNKNGTIFIAVPNYKSYDAKHYQKFWAGYDVPRHLWHFPPESMKRLLSQKKLTLEKTVPMKLDSFYVSLLSEKYKNDDALSIKGMINAVIIGLKSNYLAKRTGNYSSLIYIARK